MSRLTCSISVSLDGYVAGPDPRPEQALGAGGEQLHEWIFGLASWREMHGYEGDDPTVDVWGNDPPFAVPVFVLTHYEREPITVGQTTFTFVSDGIESALEQATEGAGGKDVGVGGGANVIQQYLRAGLLDELSLSVVPLLLGGGVRLLDNLGEAPPELERTRVVESPSGVTHLRYAVVKS